MPLTLMAKVYMYVVARDFGFAPNPDPPQIEERGNRSLRVRQPYDESSACGTQPAHEKRLNRRYHAGVLTSASMQAFTLTASRGGSITRVKITCKRS